jgi:hypothetical protein
VTTGEGIAVATGVVAVGAIVFLVVHNQNAAALAASQATAAAAARAAASAKSDFDLGASLTNVGGRLIDKAVDFALGGSKGANASDAAALSAFV